jgi:hypothetical protein
MTFPFVLLSALIAADGSPIGITSPEDKARLIELIAHFEAREVRREPVLIRYQLTEFHSSQMMGALQKNPDRPGVWGGAVQRRYPPREAETRRF